MFERFTERAREVVVFSQEEARTLGHNYIGTEHLLLGLLGKREGLAARVLESLGVTVERAREQVLGIVPGGEEVLSGQIPFTPRSKKVLELASSEARLLGDSHIGTEHLLLGLVSENQGVAARVLGDFDADPQKIRREVKRLLQQPGRAEQATSGPGNWLDWAPTEAFDLALALAPLASSITFEVRPQIGEQPTFRICCQLGDHSDVLRKLVALEERGIRAVLDGERTVRLGHLQPPPEPEEQ
ncbi:MAG: Clp protease N-terminal domain-containing protein [Solirubrobacteraceae bacterium]